MGNLLHEVGVQALVLHTLLHKSHTSLDWSKRVPSDPLEQLIPKLK